MGLFFKSAPVVPAVTESLREAVTEHPNTVLIPEQMASEIVSGVENKVSPSIYWGRLIFAIVLLCLVLAAGIYTAQDEKLSEWSKILLHSFELLLGAVIGLITGEAIAKS
jgi:hypothetical protein